jgi:hypothetical protein
MGADHDFLLVRSTVADAKTRSKWSRVLRFARSVKPANQSLTDFIKSNGGLNELLVVSRRVAYMFTNQLIKIASMHPNRTKHRVQRSVV